MSTSNTDATSVTPADDATAAANASPAAAANKRARHGVTFVLSQDGSRFDMSQAAAECFTEGLLHRLAKSDMAARDQDDCIIISQECDTAAFALAIAEHEHLAKSSSRDDTAAPLTVAINPQALYETWDYLQLPAALIRPHRMRPGTPLQVAVSHASLQQSLKLAQELHLFLSSLGNGAGALFSGRSLMHSALAEDGSCLPATVEVPFWLGDCPARGDQPWSNELWSESNDQLRWTLPGEALPAPFNYFSRELFRLLADRRRLAACVHTFLPSREEEIKHLTFTLCTAEDRGRLQELLAAELVLCPVPSITDVEGSGPRQLLGGFLCTFPILKALRTTQTQVTSHYITIGDCNLQISFHFSSVTKETIDAPEPFTPSPHLPSLKKFAATRRLHVAASMRPEGRAAMSSELPILGIACEHVSDEREESLRTARNTFFGETRVPLAPGSCPFIDVSPLLSATDFTKYLEVTDQPPLYTEQTLAPVMSKLGPALLSVSELSLEATELQGLANAWDLSDTNGAESCASHEYFLFEVHAMSPAGCPPMSCPFLAEEGYDIGKDIRKGNFMRLDISGVP